MKKIGNEKKNEKGKTAKQKSKRTCLWLLKKRIRFIDDNSLTDMCDNSRQASTKPCTNLDKFHAAFCLFVQIFHNIILTPINNIFFEHHEILW